MTPVVVDTTVASLLLDKRPPLALYQPAIDAASAVYLSFQTIAEMRFGALNRFWSVRRRQRLEQFLGGFMLVGYSDALGFRWAQVMTEAQQAGRRLEAGDAWIAATALLLNAPLLTHDKDFNAEACPSITIIRYLDAKPTS